MKACRGGAAPGADGTALGEANGGVWRRTTHALEARKASHSTWPPAGIAGDVGRLLALHLLKVLAALLDNQNRLN